MGKSWFVQCNIPTKLLPLFKNKKKIKLSTHTSDRKTNVSKELNDLITGHSSGDVAGKYGSGFSLQKRYEAMNSVEHPWLG